jgi:error-prone DNA polymerase
MFPDATLEQTERERVVALATIDKELVLENMLLDFKFTDTTLETHPVVLAKKYRWPFAHSQDRLVLAENLKNFPNGQWIHVFGMVQIIQRPPTANGMCFITLEDETGFLNLVLKPPIYQKFKSTIHGEWTLLASGRIQNQSGSLSILVSTIETKMIKNTNISIEMIERKAARALTHEKPWPNNLKFNSSLSRNGRR